ncbi:SCO family protein [Pelagibius sp. CAU 1746]|uniref:SCO family protein n=1 Tax=Pelagibius sp. CAU 1746 TaxID=3140370 RepID=UPI00325B3E9B
MSIKTRLVLIAVLGLVLAGAGFTLWSTLQRSGIVSQQGEPAGRALIGGAFTLTDQNGERRSEADLVGTYSLIYFGYTYCPDVCPTSLSAMTQGLDLLAESAPDKAAAVRPIFITIDPERDTTEAMAAYAQHFHPRLMALTGTPEEVALAAKVYRIYYQKVTEQGSSDYLMDHSSIIYLMGPDGGYLTHYTHASTADDIAKGLAEQVDPALAAGS